ncbi:MAG: type II toxin-antitoxin system VapC family toxin [Acidobacteria bacterium]|nr:type II toxin-antitoxin system VapC family toxin [Acidobacteriota bacterium]
MIVAIADTHAAIWYLFSDPRLGSGASRWIEETRAKGDHIGVSAITLAEMVYLVEKGRIPPTSIRDLYAALSDPKSVFQVVAVDEAVAMQMTGVPREEIPDLPDRVIAATALLRGIPVLSRDGRIRSSGITTIW